MRLARGACRPGGPAHFGHPPDAASSGFFYEYHCRHCIHYRWADSMNKTLIALLALLALVAGGTAQAQTSQSGLKAGLWETRTLRMTVDGQDMTAQMAAAAEQMKKQLASLPPEQRKKAEAAMGQHGGDPMTQRMCVSAEMAARDQTMVPRPPQADCEPPKLNRSGNRTSFEIACKQAGGKLTGKGETVVADGLITTKVETKSTDGAGKAHAMMAETQMKYLGANCGSVKPIEQQVREMQGKAARADAAKPVK